MNKLIGKTQTKEIKQFSTLVASGIDSWTKAGELIVKMVDKNDKTYENILQELPDMSYDILSKFEQIGRKQLFPKLLLGGSTGVRRLTTLPYSEQVKYHDEPMDVAVEIDGGVDTLKVQAKDLTSFQVKQVFDNGTVRDIGAQRAWLRSRDRKPNVVKAAKQDGKPWTIKKDGTLFVRADTILTMPDIANIMALMAK